MDKKSLELPRTELLRNHSTLTEQKSRETRYIQLATADNTRRAYQSAIRHFERWGGLLPTDTSTVCRYLSDFAESLNPRTLALRLTALKAWHKAQSFPDPTDSLKVTKLLSGIKREHGEPKKKAKVLNVEHLSQITLHLQNQATLKASRDLALILVGIAGAFRRSELVSLQIEQLQWEPEGLLINLPRSKTDPMGEGITKAIPYGNQTLCPVKALSDYLEQANISSGTIFRQVNRWQKISDEGLKPGSVNIILKSVATDCGIAFANELSGHSLRRSLATTAYRAGASFESIKRQGGWKSDATVWEYVEEAKLFEDNPAQFLFNAAVNEYQEKE